MTGLQSLLYDPFAHVIRSDMTLSCLIDNERPGVGWEAIRMAPYAPIVENRWEHAGLHVTFQAPGAKDCKLRTITLFRVGLKELSTGTFLHIFENGIVLGPSALLWKMNASLHWGVTMTYLRACRTFSDTAKLYKMVFDPEQGTFVQDAQAPQQ